MTSITLSSIVKIKITKFSELGIFAQILDDNLNEIKECFILKKYIKKNKKIIIGSLHNAEIIALSSDNKYCDVKIL